MIATRFPSCAARIAATYPPGPAPSTTTSKRSLTEVSLLIDTKVHHESTQPRIGLPVSSNTAGPMRLAAALRIGGVHDASRLRPAPPESMEIARAHCRAV